MNELFEEWGLEISPEQEVMFRKRHFVPTWDKFAEDGQIKLGVS